MKLCDFGFARTIQTKTSNLTDYVATRWYRSPELLIGEKEYGKPLDMWSIGCIMAEMLDGQPLFPGESEIDQLYLIQKTLGPLTASQQETFQKNPRFIGLKFPEISKLETLEKRFLKLEPLALDFMNKLLCMNPDTRMNASQALTHPYLNDCKESNENPSQASRVESAKARGRFTGNIAISKNKRLLLLSNAPTDSKKPGKINGDTSVSPVPTLVKENQALNTTVFDSSKNKTTTNKDNFIAKFRATPFIVEQNVEFKQETRLDRQKSKEVLRNQEGFNEIKQKKRKTHVEEVESDVKFSPISKPMVIKKKSKLLYPADSNEAHGKNLRSGVFNRYLPKQTVDSEEHSNQLSARQLPNIYSNYYQEKKGKGKAEDPDLGGGPHHAGLIVVEEIVQNKRNV